MYLRTKTLGTFVIITWVNSSSTQVFPGLPRTGIIHIFEKPDEYLGIAVHIRQKQDVLANKDIRNVRYNYLGKLE